MSAIDDKKHSLRILLQNPKFVWFIAFVLPLLISRIISHLYYNIDEVEISINSIRKWENYYKFPFYYAVYYVPSLFILWFAIGKRKSLLLFSLATLLMFPVQEILDFLMDCVLIYKMCD